jgi:hypothetical protein
MYLNFFSEGRLPKLSGSAEAAPQAIVLPPSSSPHVAQITVLRSRSHPVNKRFFVGSDGQVQKENFQHAFLYDARLVQVEDIDGLAKLIEASSQDDHLVLIRGLPTDAKNNIRRTKENFAEHAEGTPWVMLDFDDIAVPDGIDPLSPQAIEWVISELPPEFHDATYFYQHSGSAGILRQDGTPMKPGLNAHLFFWLSRPVSGKTMAAYLRQHCMENGFYRLGANQGDIVMLTPGIDPAPIRSEVQPHFIAAPMIEAGVQCLLTATDRQGLVRKDRNSVAIPEIAADIERQARRLQDRILDDYKREHGYVIKTMVTTVKGKLAVTRYSVAPSEGQVRVSRELAETKLSDDKKFLTLYFTDEGSPGSWYVCQDRPQLGIRYGDSARCPLNELSAGAHQYVRDELRWFTEAPHHDLSLIDGYLPPISSFATAKVSLILSPTGSGKTVGTIAWIQEQTHQRKLVLYAAPTIALVKQMRDDLQKEGISSGFYQDIRGFDIALYRVIVTTNDSLPKLLKQVYDEAVPHVLIFDEIHQGLDRFMGSEKFLRGFEDALSKAGQSLLLTGTLTDTQRLALVEEAKQAPGCLTEANYCCYEFLSGRRNPLEIASAKYFDSHLPTLLADFQSKRQQGEPLPRLVLLMDTSRMEMYRLMVERYGLTDQAMIVSRQENTEEEIEAARISTLPILISSPLFGLGLNFAREPDILWARFDHIGADTNQVIQTVNRANRGRRSREDEPCQVRIYGNVKANAEFRIPDRVALKDKVAERFEEEASLAGMLEDHLQLDRVTYRLLREEERESSTALSVLARNDAIQNFHIVEAQLDEIEREKAADTKQARKDAREGYNQAIAQASIRYRNASQDGRALLALDRLCEERNNNWRQGSPRTEREIETELAGVFLGWLQLAKPGQARKVSVAKVRRLFCEHPLWGSEQYARDKYPEWAKVEAEKMENLGVLVEKLEQLCSGEITAEALSALLTRNKLLKNAFLALANNDTEFQSISAKFETLEAARKVVRDRGGDAQRKKVKEQGLALLRELLEPLGIGYGEKESGGRQVTDDTEPIVPVTLDLSMIKWTLKREAERLRALPPGQKEAAILFSVDEWDGRLPDPIPIGVCQKCVWFRTNCRDCSAGKYMDWQDFGELPEAMCEKFRVTKHEAHQEWACPRV